MSFTDEYLKLREKRKKEEAEALRRNLAPVVTTKKDEGIAPVREEASGIDFFQKGSFEDGFDWHDIPSAILGTAADAGLNVAKGLGGIAEGLADFTSYGIAGIADLVGADDYADLVRKDAKKNTIDSVTRGAENYLNKYSLLGNTSDAIMQGVGQAGTIIATGGVAAGAGLSATAATMGLMGVSGVGSGMSEAYQNGATDLEALKHGLNTGATDAVSELIFGGLGKAINAVGLSKGLSSADDMLAKLLGSKFKNKAARNLVEYGIKASAEGLEEVIAGVAQAYSKHSTYMSDEDFLDILKDENLIEQFLVGTITSGVAQAPSLHIANTSKTDFITGQTQNEQAVVKKETENRIAEAEKDGKKLTAKEKSEIEARVEKDMEKGYISTDTIEEVLGGDSYKTYKDASAKEEAVLKELESLYEGEELAKRQQSIRDNSTLSELKEKLGQTVSEMVKNDRLSESYNERSRRSQKYEADLSGYDEKQRKVVQKAIDSGVLNNTNRSHELVDLIAKIGGDKDLDFDFTNNEKLKESGFALDGVTVNGFVNENGVTVNVNSAKALNSVVGHEITHVLEDTEVYTELEKALTEYAKGKNEYDTRLKKLVALYENVDGYKGAEGYGKIKKELIADLAGDYLFTDKEFVNRLSTGHRNVFQKIFDEVKYLCRVATAGSKEARELERVKKVFEEAYRTETKNPTEDGGVRYSLSKNAKTELHKALYDTKYRDDVRLRDITPAIMLGHNGVENLPMAMKASHIRENVFTEDEARKLGLRVDDDTHYHGLGEDLFLQVIDGLDNVKEAYRGTRNAADPTRREDYFLLVSEFKDKDGNTINVPVYINRHAQVNRVFVDVNKISTVYGKEALRDYITRQVKNRNLVRIKRKSIESSERAAPMAAGYRNDASTDSIRNPNADVNNKNSLSEKAQTDTDGLFPLPWQVKGKDVALEGLAPVGVAETTKASVSEMESVAPVAENATAEPVSETDMFPMPGDIEGKYEATAQSAQEQSSFARSLRYKASKVNQSILQLVNRVKQGQSSGNEKVQLTVISDDVATRIQKLTGVDVHGYKVAVEARQVDHILKEHGENGRTDHSMANAADIAKMEYALENPDSIVKAGTTRAYVTNKNGKMKPADTVLYEKQNGDGSYYVVQAVPDTNKKTLYIVTAFIGKKGYKKGEAPQSTNANSPGATPEAESVVASDNIISRTEPIVNDDIAPVAENATTTEMFPDDLAPVKEQPVAEAYEAIRPKREPSSEPRMVRADSRGKQRKWVGTSTESDAVDGKVLPDDLDQDLIHYQPISNKKTLGNANAKLNSVGYESSISYINSQFANNKVTLDDIALGERLIQEAVKRGDTKTAGDLIMDISILGTELGQKVQALSIIKRLTPEGQLRMLQRTVERGKTKGDKAFEGVEITQEMIDHILKTYGKDGTYDQAELNKRVEDVKQKIADQMKVSAMDYINEWRYLAMLGNPKTHIRNIVSNAAMWGTRQVKNAIARTIEDIAPVKNRTKTWKFASEDVKNFAKQVTSEMYEGNADNKYSEGGSIKAKRQILPGVIGKASNLNSKSLSGEDTFFSKPAFQSALREYLTANGIETEADIKQNGKLVVEAKQYAMEQAKEATFQQDSYIASKISEIERKNPLFNVAIGSVLPFKKTPINIAKTAASYSPLGFARNIYDAVQVSKGNMDASEAVDHLAQTLTGTSLTLIGYMLAQAGILNGAGDDDKEGKYDYQLGKQSYSFNFNGDTYSLSWLSPVAMPLFVGTNAYEQLVEGKDWNADVVFETLAQTLDPLSEMSFLSSLDSVLSSYDSGVEKFMGIFESAGQSYITQFVPTLSSQVAQVLDDTKRSTKASADSGFKFGEETINKLMYKIPGLRSTLEPTTDIWGDEVKQSENFLARAFESFLAPYAKREDIATAVDEEIKDLYSQTGDTGVIPSIPNNYVSYDGEKYEMSANEFTEFKKMYGQTAVDLMERLFRTNTYRMADSETRADMVNRVYDYARDAARKEYFSKQGVEFTNATEDGKEVYKEDPIKGAIVADMPVDEYVFSEEYPAKYSFFKKNGISYSQYASADEDGKRAYTWAYENPGKYTMSKAISDDVVTYRKYTGELYDIRADKDENGDSISGSAKEKKIDYINNLDLEYGQKIILFKSLYKSDDTYNYDIIEYLNEREDISYEEMVTILKELGFTVSGNSVSW